MPNPSIYCLHGFLGLPTDWDLFPGFVGESLYHSIQPFPDWVFHFHKKVPKQKILLGYSLGGRLALHALITHPENWQGAVIISAHPGMQSNQLRKERYVQDCLWAKRFEEESWDLLMNDWNNQSIFNGTSLNRSENDFERRQLSDALRTWSLGLQEDLSSAIANLELPILWITGEKDPKFVQLALKTKHKHSKIWVASGAGHRVPWDNPKDFYQQVYQFCEEIL